MGEEGDCVGYTSAQRLVNASIFVCWKLYNRELYNPVPII